MQGRLKRLAVGALALAALSLGGFVSPAAAEPEKRTFFPVRHGSLLTFHVRGVDPHSVQRAWVVVGKYRRQLPVERVRPAVGRGVVQVSVPRRAIRRWARGGDRRVGRPRLVLLIDACHGGQAGRGCSSGAVTGAPPTSEPRASEVGASEPAYSEPGASEPSPAPAPVFSDDFDGDAESAPDPAKWRPADWCDKWGSNPLSCSTDRAQNVSLDGQGHAKVVAHRESWTDHYGVQRDYTSGRLETGRRFRFTYGTLSARIKVPAGKGLWPSFWTTGTGSWPAGGEIDVMESLGHQPSTAYCSVHGADSAGEHASTTRRYSAPAPLTDDFHVYTAHWTATGVTFEVDGRPCGTVSTAGMQPFTAQQIRVGMTVGGSWPGAPDASTAFPATMLIDWVRVYE